MITPPNNSLKNNNRGSSSQPIIGSPTGRGATPDQNRFSVTNAKMPQPNSAVSPGKGDVPVNPWSTSGAPMTAAKMPDSMKPPKAGR